MIELSIRVVTLAAALTLTIVNCHVKAQAFLLSENFEQFPSGNPALPTNGWINNVLSGDASVDQWVFDNPGGRISAAPVSGKFAIFDSDWNSQNAIMENVAMESPSFSAQGFQKVLLRFDQHYDGVFNAGDSILVEVFDGNTWNWVYSYNGVMAITSSETVDISTAVNNSSVASVRFRFVGNWSYFWILDNISVVGYYNYDAAALTAKFTHTTCGDANDSLEVEISNGGLTPATNFVVSANLSGNLGGAQINSNVSTLFTGTLSNGARATVKLAGLNTTLGGTVNVRVWTELLNEEYFENDSSQVIVISFLGIPGGVNVTNGARCGQGSVTLQASGVGTGDSVFWYGSPQASAPLSTGSKFTTPVTGPGTFNYYVSSGRGLAHKNIFTTYSGGNGQSGVMFNVHAYRTLVVDSFEVNMDAGVHQVEVYYKRGMYQGFESNASAWTLLGSTTVVSTAPVGGTGTCLKVGSLMLPTGSDYAFYIQLPNSTSINYTTGNITASNSDILLEAGIGKSANFGVTFSPRSFNGMLHYSLFPLCEGPRQVAQVLVTPLTPGSALLKGTPFQGQFRAGTPVLPHIVAQGDSLSIDIQAPSGTNNLGYGTDWVVLGTEFLSMGGAPVNSADTFTRGPSAGKNASFFFVPSSGSSDSVYRLRVTVRTVFNSCDTVMENIFYVAPRPVSLFSASGVCDGETVQFLNQSTISSGTMTYSWDFGDGKTSNLINPGHVYAAAGAYQVTLTATSDYGYSSQLSKLVIVNPRPVSNFEFTNACEGAPVVLNNISQLPLGNTKFLWAFGDGTFDSLQHASHSYQTPGSYIVTLKTEVNSCSSVISKLVTQAPRARVGFNTTTSCNNKQVTFVNSSQLSSGTMGYFWDFGDGTFSTAAQPRHSYSGFGNFMVKLKTYTILGCIDSLSVLINLLQAPSASFSYSSPCVGQSIQFDNTSQEPLNFVNEYSWDFGDGTTSHSEFPSHTFAGEGKFVVTLRSSSSNGCVDSLKQDVLVSEKPQAGIVAQYVLCDGEEAEILNATTSSKPNLISYAWDFGNGHTSTAKDTGFVYAGPGIYKIRLVARISGGCADSVSHTIRISAVPSADFIMESKYTRDGSFWFASLEPSPGVAHQWFFGDGEKSSQPDPDHRYKTDGTYFVRLITRNADYCFNEMEDTLHVYRTGLGEPVKASGMSLYPNPNQGRFVLEMIENRGGIQSLSVVNALGQEMSFEQTPAVDGNTELTLRNPVSGVYHVKVVYAGGKVEMIPFVVGN